MKLSRAKQRVPATTLSTPRAFTESLTPRSNLAVEDAVEFTFGSSSSVAAFGLTLL